jgi:hypothetical protein
MVETDLVTRHLAAIVVSSSGGIILSKIVTSGRG